MKKPIERTPYVFVYGTLMEGFGNNRLLKDSSLIENATTEDGYVLVANGIPYLLEDQGKSYVHGEIYKVNEKTLENLDTLEGHPNWYARKVINVVTEQGDRLKAWAYFMPKKPNGVVVVESGDYREHVKQTIY
jgi:gamma-glutamylcyclotransferase (GGCT)/AIG2-like uncharacterized protein YtfP